METKRFKDINWDLANGAGNIATWQNVQIAVLMDIRDELKRLNAAIYCPNFIAIPSLLRKISENTKKRKYKKK